MNGLQKFPKDKIHFINEIINIIKKYNITLEDIAKEYIYKYEYIYNSNDQNKFKTQYHLINNHLNIFNKFNKTSINELDSSTELKTIWFDKYTIIEDYILL